MPIHHIPLALVLASLLYISEIQIRPSLPNNRISNKRYSWHTTIKHITQTDQAHIHADKNFKNDRCKNNNFKCNGGNPVQLWDKSNKRTNADPEMENKITKRKKKERFPSEKPVTAFAVRFPLSGNRSMPHLTVDFQTAD
ncbi:uncharacterized protein BO88DRAFT_218950 [Aspergillus vadensis CBS 113365]|uniref:Secreted protein n=1 Tax=Aspergillus vadensis (strain CBS 113365 / IMI 142717 / IBT 24658) TaxID=1448311 RepID=A0A319AZT4_ASPVC|nr:hypothetical protein BO88DRAFT_218950 [Aspergillus vadensis CBS 113365]PYH63410.1 hypothetical protein BO88DRAFT_218950 [Aspergillus vadensis CBS 113365]